MPEKVTHSFAQFPVETNKPEQKGHSIILVDVLDLLVLYESINLM